MIRVVILGIDGSGKSTVSAILIDALKGGGLRVAHRHFRGLRRPSSSAAVTETGDPPRSRLTNLVRTFLFASEYVFDAAWLRLTRTDVVVQERSYLDLKADPDRYRFRRDEAEFTATVLRCISREAVAVHCAGDPRVFVDRKPEVSLPRAQSQDQAIRAVLGRSCDVHLVLLTTHEPPATLESVLAIASAIRVVAKSRLHHRLGAPFRLAQQVTSEKHGSAQYVPESPARRALIRLLRPIHIPPRSLSHEIVSLATLPRTTSPTKVLSSIRSSYSQRRVIASSELVFKIGNSDDTGLRREVALMERLAGTRAVPTMLSHSHDAGHICISIPRVGRHLLQSDVEAGRFATDLGTLLTELAAVEVAHGDLAPWNLRVLDDHSLLAIDWEASLDESNPVHDLAVFLDRAAGWLGWLTVASAVRLVLDVSVAAPDCQISTSAVGLALSRLDAASPHALKTRSEMADSLSRIGTAQAH